MMSNPATQVSTAPPSTSAGSRSAGFASTASPRMAIHAATGDSASAAPSQKWASDVNRFA